MATTVSYGSVTGALPAAARDQLSSQVQAVVDGWYDAAYLGSGGGDSWPGFTAGAKQEAQQDADLMSNQSIGAVEAKKRSVKIDVLAVKKHPVGVTAHVRLVLATTGADQKVVRIAGRLYLTRGKQGWQVFGYDVTKADA